MADSNDLQARLERLGAPGYQYAHVVGDDQIEIVVGGMARLPDQPMTADATLNTYSVAKTLTAAAVLLLAERGKLDLDAPLQEYVALTLPYAERPTVRQTLAHTGGFPNPLPLAWVHPAGQHAQFDRQAFIAEVLRKHAKLTSPPGKSFRYSNLGYLLLGEVVEQTSGSGFESFVETELIRPLALPAGAVLGFEIPDEQRHAAGYIRRFGLLDLLLGLFADRAQLVGASIGRWVEIRRHRANGAAFGGLIANSAGLACYLRALLAADWPMPAVHRLLFEPTQIVSGPVPGRALGWFRGALQGHTYFAHAGGGAAYYSEARLYPSLARASVLMINRAGVSDARALDDIDTAVLP